MVEQLPHVQSEVAARPCTLHSPNCKYLSTNFIECI